MSPPCTAAEYRYQPLEHPSLGPDDLTLSAVRVITLRINST